MPVNWIVYRKRLPGVLAAKRSARYEARSFVVQVLCRFPTGIAPPLFRIQIAAPWYGSIINHVFLAGGRIAIPEVSLQIFNDF
jgi:hypothetical protein